MKNIGSFIVAATFEEHMDPSVFWVEDPDFEREFDRLLEAGSPGTTEGSKPTMAAHTNAVDPISGASTSYPAFINIRFEDGRAIVTMRGDPIHTPAVEGGQPEHHAAAPQVQATFEQHDWDQFVAEATRERGLVPGG